MSCEWEGHVGCADGPHGELRCLYCGSWANAEGVWLEDQEEEGEE